MADETDRDATPEPPEPDQMVSSWRHSTDPALAEPEPEPRSKAPIIIGGVALLVVLGLVALVAGLVSRQGPSGVPTASAEATRAPLELPLKVNELQRDPNAQAPSVGPTTGSELSTVTAVYDADGTPTLVVLASRPVKDANEMLAQVQARAIRQVGDAWCGREPTQDIDVCVVMKDSDTAVMGGGLDKQPVEEIVAQARAVSDAMPS